MPVKYGQRYRAPNGSIVKIVKVIECPIGLNSTVITYEYEFSPGTLWRVVGRCAFLSRFTPVEASQ